MGKQGLAKGIMAAGQILGDYFSKKDEQERQDKLRAEKQAEDRRRFDLQRKDQELRNEQMKIQTTMMQAKQANKALVDAWTISDGNPEVMAAAFSEHSGRPIAYRYNPALADNEGEVGFDIGTYETDPVTGKPKLGADGKKIFVPAPGEFKQQVFKNRDDYTNFFMKMANHNTLFSEYQAKITAKEQRELFKFKTQEKAKAEKDVAEGTGKEELNRAQAALARAKAKDPDLTTTTGAKTARDTVFETPFGKVTKSSQAMTNLRDNRKAMEANFYGITDAEVVILDEVRKRPEIRKELSAGAKMARDNPKKANEIIKKISEKLQISRDVARAIIENEKQFLAKKKRWWERD